MAAAEEDSTGAPLPALAFARLITVGGMLLPLTHAGRCAREQMGLQIGC